MSFRVIFILLVVLLNFGFAGLEVHLLRRRRPAPRGLIVFVVLWAVAMGGLGLVQLFSPAAWRPFLRQWAYFPLSVEMVWNLLFVQLLFLGGIVVTLVLGRARRVDRTVALAPQDLSRRKFIYTVACGATPAVALGMGVHGTATRDDLRVREFNVPIANLPPELEGFTIAHVSDLHSGLFCGAERLRRIGVAANDLKADLMVLTGDVINMDMSEFAPALEMIRTLESRHGTFLCEGNHDLIPGPFAFDRACAENRLALLRDSAVTLKVEGRRLILAGVPWDHGDTRRDSDRVTQLFPERQEGDLRLLLAHHPNDFDIASSADLVLSGHTHGGQIMVGPLGFGPLFFKYWSGFYRRDATTMIVSNGAGDWFPCRIGAPAEVGRLRLTRAV